MGRHGAPPLAPLAVFWFIARRLLQLLFVLWGGASLLFFLFFALPSDPAELMAGGANRVPDPQVVANIRAKYGLDEPLVVQYGKFMGRLATGDLGESYKTKERVSDVIERRLPTSLRLAFWATALEAVVGISGGVLSARRRNSFADAFTTGTAVIAGAIPVFLLAFLLKQVTGVYAFQHNWPDWAAFPPLGFGPNTWYLWIFPTARQFEYLLQPVLILAAVSTAIIARLTRTSVLETLRMDHVRTARAKGLTEGVVVRKHVLRNALIPIVTYIGIDFGTLVGSAILTETVFNIGGVGSAIAHAARDRDLPVVMGLSVVVIGIYGLANLAVDLSYAMLDPRIRMGEA